MTSAQSCLHDNAHLCLRQVELATESSRCRCVSSQETLNSVVLAGLISLSPQQADASVMLAMKRIERWMEYITCSDAGAYIQPLYLIDYCRRNPRFPTCSTIVGIDR